MLLPIRARDMRQKLDSYQGSLVLTHSGMSNGFPIWFSCWEARGVLMTVQVARTDLTARELRAAAAKIKDRDEVRLQNEARVGQQGTLTRVRAVSDPCGPIVAPAHARRATPDTRAPRDT